MELTPRRLGRSHVHVPAVGLGTAPLGGMYAHVAEEQALDVVRAALDAGATYLDTAPQYGHGTAERRLGAALATLGPAGRPGLVVSTKVGRIVVPAPESAEGPVSAEGPDVVARSIFADAPPSEVVFDFSPAGVQRSLAESLDRLGLDRVDIVYLHDPDDHADEALSQAFPVLRRWRDEGVVGAIGVGMNQSAVPARFVREADPDVVLLAGRWSVLDRSGGADLMPLALERGVSVVVGGVFNSGLLADPRPGARFDYGIAPAHLVARAQALAAACARYDVPLKAAALQFPFRHPAVASVLTGARSRAELEENLALLDVEVPEPLWADLDAIATAP
jgi:D-threo-aldose 1-dehydrogenase